MARIDFATKRAEHLKSHMRKHSDDKPFRCSTCGKLCCCFALLVDVIVQKCAVKFPVALTVGLLLLCCCCGLSATTHSPVMALALPWVWRDVDFATKRKAHLQSHMARKHGLA